MTDRVRQLATDSVVYGLGGILARGVSFLLLPVYTRIFTPLEYGTIEMVLVIASLLSACLVMGMDSAQSFYFFEQKARGREAQSRLVSAILQWRLVSGAVLVVAAAALAPVLNAWLFDGVLELRHFAVAFAGALFAAVMGQGVELYRLFYRPWPYIGLILLHTVLGAALILLFVLGFDQGIFGFLAGSTAASLAVAVTTWGALRGHLRFSVWHTDWWPRLLRFGLPLVPAALGFYIMSTADRWFVQHYHGPEQVGIYAVAAKFALIMALSVETFRKAWWPIALDAMHDSDGPETFRTIARLYVGLGTAAVVYLAFLAPWIVRLFTGPAFHGAYPVVGVLAWQALFYGFYLFVTAGLWKAEKTHWVAGLMLVGAGLNIALNFLWVPTWGAMGAAAATAVSHFVWVCITGIVANRFWRVGFPVGLLLAQVGVGAAVVIALLFFGRGLGMFVLVHLAVIILVASSIEQREFSKWRAG